MSPGCSVHELDTAGVCRRCGTRVTIRYLDLGQNHPSTVTTVTRLIGVPVCPDLIDWWALGEADNLRGHVVRAFFWLIRWWR
jgi:hypothetical protein